MFIKEQLTRTILLISPKHLNYCLKLILSVTNNALILSIACAKPQLICKFIPKQTMDMIYITFREGIGYFPS